MSSGGGAGLEMPAAGYGAGWTGDYVPVPHGCIDDGTSLECDLYWRHPGRQYVLFLAADVPFSEAERMRLLAGRGRRLFIRREDLSLYSRYALGRIAHAAEADGIPVARRAEVCYESSRFLLDRAFSDPRAETITDVKDGVSAAVDVAIQRPEVMVSLMRLTRHDSYTYSHSMNVAIFGMALTLAVGTRDGWERRVAQGLFLHDIGKSRVPAEIINWPGKLSPEQWAVMRQHPELGVRILNEVGEEDEVVIAIAHQHHERGDGSGYPLGLHGTQIIPEARICTIADVFDALTTQRSYKPKHDTFSGLRIMIDEMRDEFDPEFFEAFIRLFERNPDLSGRLR